MRLIEICDSKNGYLSVDLLDILNALPEDASALSWSILPLEAVGDLGPKRSMLLLEQEVRNSTNGLHTDWSELLELAGSIADIINAKIPGCSIGSESICTAPLTDTNS